MGEGVVSARDPRTEDRMTAQGQAAVTIADDAEAQRYVARVDGQEAGFLEYLRERDVIVLVHTETLPAFEGKGVGSALARRALDAARDARVTVIPQCPFVREYIRRHPEYQDTVSK
jgi:predicted GNAT family acetyltransferase